MILQDSSNAEFTISNDVSCRITTLLKRRKNYSSKSKTKVSYRRVIEFSKGASLKDHLLFAASIASFLNRTSLNRTFFTYFALIVTGSV